MKTPLLVFFLFLISWPCLQAQNPDLHACGTQMGRSKWLKKYQANPSVYRHGADTILWVPLTIHVLGNDNGAGYFANQSIYDALCTLNADFEQADIQFYLREDFRFINSTAYNDHPNVDVGAEMMFTYNVDSTLNCYIMDGPAGNCGYNLPYAGIALGESCAGPDDHTWAHEVGHALSLPHPFLGWEGGQTHDGSVPAVYNEPAPETVTYDYTSFQQVYYTDTLIIDTALVEKMDGSNCHEAADGFCDTPPDYLAFRWSCNSNNSSTISQTDPNGVQFISDGQWIMSYALDNCSSTFSAEQIAAMRANLMGPKLHYLFRDTPQPAVTEVADLIQPIDGETAQFDNVVFSWNAVANANRYEVRINLLIGNTPVFLTREITNDTFLILDNLPNNRNLSWEVAAFSTSSFCLQYSAAGNFRTGVVTSTVELDQLGQYDIHPNLLSSGQSIYIRVNAEKTADLEVGLYDLSGRLLQADQYIQKPGAQQFEFFTADHPSGLYILNLKVGDQQIVEKVMIR